MPTVKTTTRITQANATRPSVDNAGKDPLAKAKSMASRLYDHVGGPSRLAPARFTNKPPATGAPAARGGDPWRPGDVQTVGQKPVETKGAVPVTTHPVRQGNQGPAHAPHTQPGKIKPTGTPAQMRDKSSPDSQSALERVGGKKLGKKDGFSNAARVLYGNSASSKSTWPGRKAA